MDVASRKRPKPVEVAITQLRESPELGLVELGRRPWTDHDLDRLQPVIVELGLVLESCDVIGVGLGSYQVRQGEFKAKIRCGKGTGGRCGRHLVTLIGRPDGTYFFEDLHLALLGWKGTNHPAQARVTPVHPRPTFVCPRHGCTARYTVTTAKLDAACRNAPGRDVFLPL